MLAPILRSRRTSVGKSVSGFERIAAQEIVVLDPPGDSLARLISPLYVLPAPASFRKDDLPAVGEVFDSCFLPEEAAEPAQVERRVGHKVLVPQMEDVGGADAATDLGDGLAPVEIPSRRLRDADRRAAFPRH